MASLKEIKGRISSVRSTLKITSAMKMVSSTKLHKAQQAAQHCALYEEELAKILSIAGGEASVMMAARYGIARGLFSNESGLGSAPIVAAAAQTRNPVRQALVSSSGTFWDTVVICALTGLVIVSSIIAYPDIDYSNGAALTKEAFAKIPYVGTAILSTGLVTFAFSTAIGWCYYRQAIFKFRPSF